MYYQINVELIFLFFYSFDFNLIKILFVVLKRWIKRNKHLIQKYKSKFENFERFFHETMQIQIERNNFNKLFWATNYNYNN